MLLLGFSAMEALAVATEQQGPAGEEVPHDAAAARSTHDADVLRTWCCFADPCVGSPLVSRQQGLRVPPLRGRWCQGDYVYGTGGGRLPGGRVVTELDGIVFRRILESLDQSTRHGTRSPQTPLSHSIRTPT